MGLALIVGTGLDETRLAEGAGDARTVTTRFGAARLHEVDIADIRVLLLPRHGEEHSIAPHLIDYRAQIAALKASGAKRVIGVSAVGSLVAGLGPGSLVVLGDFVDLTRRRADTFFDEPGEVAHTDFSRPYCPEISRALAGACRAAGVGCCENGVYVCVEGPRYETPAEVRLFRSWGGDVVGMTGLPEAALAREAGLCYGGLAVVTNCPAAPSPAPLSHDEVRATMLASEDTVFDIVGRAIGLIPTEASCGCASNRALRL